MDDLISRQAAIEHLKKRLYETEFSSVAEYPYYAEIADNRVDVWMNEVPAAQPERKTGKWLQISPAGIYECSECGQTVMTKDISCYKFCHGCGAYMGGEQDE